MPFNFSIANSSRASGQPVLFVIGMKLATLSFQPLKAASGKKYLFEVLRVTVKLSSGQVKSDDCPAASKPRNVFSSILRD